MAGPFLFSTRDDAQIALTYVHYAAPIVLLLFFLLAFTLRSVLVTEFGKTPDAKSQAQNGQASQPVQLGPGGKPLPPRKVPTQDNTLIASLDFSKPRKLLFDWLAAFCALSFLGNAAIVILHALVERKKGWWCGEAPVVYIVGCFFVYCLFLISMVDTKPAPTTAHLSTWAVALILEIFILTTSITIYSGEHKETHVRKPGDHGFKHGMTDWEAAEVLVNTLRLVLLFALIFFYLIFVVSRNRTIRAVKQSLAEEGAHESTGLLDENGDANGSAQPHANGYGSAATGGKHKHTEGAPPGWERPTRTPSRSWWEYLKGYTVFFPYLWPSKDRRLQLVVLVCFVIVALQRVVNLLVPASVNRITNILAGENGPPRMPWAEVCLFLLYRYLQGNQGLLGTLRAYLWIPVSQYSYRELSVASFEHVHSLSLEFHLGKKTGEVLSALGKGSSINTFLEQISFSVLPMLVDLILAIGYFLYAYGAYYSLVVSVVTFWYIYLTIRMAQWRADIRREMVNADRDEEAVKNDSMVSYETVKYFNAEPWEFQRYKNAVARYQKAEYRVLSSLNLMNTTQNSVFLLGLLITCLLVSYQVTSGERKVGDFAGLLFYMSQLQQPLNFFGTFYRMIQSAMINSERMLELFKEKPTVLDGPDALPLATCEGNLAFNDVKFAYDSRKPALSGLDFTCKPGTTTALVGESGGGKSTVFRLLFRFYNAQAGSIQIDGHDVNNVTIDSLRQKMAVVPQDTVLFNETLMYNLKYASQSATDDDVFRACEAASIHDKILTFPDGYNTRVGERGLRLSGGEKQRVAIARAILKNPRIILLDEATAALDTETEQHIQSALQTLSQGRTMLIIAHRLSTITNADQILVLHAGVVAERGTHDELLARKGRYAKMWSKQIRAQRAAEEARALKDQVRQLTLETGGEASASQSDDERERSRRESPDGRDGHDDHDGTNTPQHGKPHGHP